MGHRFHLIRLVDCKVKIRDSEEARNKITFSNLKKILALSGGV